MQQFTILPYVLIYIIKNLNLNTNEITWYYLIFKFLPLCITKLLSLSSESTLLHFASSCWSGDTTNANSSLPLGFLLYSDNEGHLRQIGKQRWEKKLLYFCLLAAKYNCSRVPAVYHSFQLFVAHSEPATSGSPGARDD